MEISLINAIVHPCTQYALDVVAGRRVTGHMEMLACQRHLDDLARRDDAAFPWIFDEEKANRIYDWFKYCRHTEGQLAGESIELLPFQQFDLGCIFGWVGKETGIRRFEKAYIQVARKNGKSTEMSGIGLFLMCGDGEESPKVYCAAVDREQARIVFDGAKRMAYKSQDIKKRLKIRQAEINHISRGGRMMPLSKETQNKDGLNPSGAIIDEYHAHKTSEIFDLIWTAWGHRSQALMMIISTAGMDANNSPCFREYQLCKQIIDPASDIKNERYFVMIRELDPGDDEHDPANWIKANPLRAASPEGLAKLKDQHDEAFTSKDPSKIRTFRIKILNRWIYDSDASYMGEIMSEWDKLAVTPKEFAELTKGALCLVGLDLSKKIDLTGDGFIFALQDGRVAVTARGFIPEGAVVRHEQTDLIPYRDWAADGWVKITDGDVTDYDEIKTHVHDVELDYLWKVLEICYDPYNATHLANEMTKDGYVCVEIRQGVRTLSEPTKLFRELVAQGKIVHDGSPLLKWCVYNAKEVTDNNENIKITKKNVSDTNRVDLLTAILTGMVRLPALRDAGPVDISDEILNDEWGM